MLYGFLFDRWEWRLIVGAALWLSCDDCLELGAFEVGLIFWLFVFDVDFGGCFGYC